MAAISERSDLSGILIGIRRAAIVVILLLGYIYFRAAGEAYALVGIGLISFAAVAQFAPAMFGGMYWKQGTHAGAVAGSAGGFVVWLYTLLLPSSPLGLDRQGLRRARACGVRGAQGAGTVRFGRTRRDLALPVVEPAGQYRALCAGVAKYPRPDALEAGQAERFVDVFRHGGQRRCARCGVAARRSTIWSACSNVFSARSGRASNWRLCRGAGYGRLAARCPPMPSSCVSPKPTVGRDRLGQRPRDGRLVAREENLGLDEVLDILDEATQVRAYSRELETKSQELEAATAELREANERCANSTA
jgi:hypothetical protein